MIAYCLNISANELLNISKHIPTYLNTCEHLRSGGSIVRNGFVAASCGSCVFCHFLAETQPRRRRDLPEDEATKKLQGESQPQLHKGE